MYGFFLVLLVISNQLGFMLEFYIEIFYRSQMIPSNKIHGRIIESQSFPHHRQLSQIWELLYQALKMHICCELCMFSRVGDERQG
jgi:hypothetical protein